MYYAASPKTTKQTIILKSFDSDFQHKAWRCFKMGTRSPCRM